MSFDRINHLLKDGSFYLKLWDDRYSEGTWAVLEIGGWDFTGYKEEEGDVVRNLSNASDCDMEPAVKYILSTEWMPYVRGDSIVEAMQKLEDRLASLPQDQLNGRSEWADFVCNAVRALSDATHGRSWYGELIPHDLNPLPKTFDLLKSPEGE